MTTRRSAGRLLRDAATVLLSLSLTMVFTGCDIFNRPTDAVASATRVIDAGIRDIRSNLSTWQMVLQRVANQLPKEVSELIRIDAQNLANRSIATLGVEFKCSVDFLGNRAIQSLNNLKAELLNQKAAPLPPSFCGLDMGAIKLADPPATWSTVMLNGYDLDFRDKANNRFRVFLLDQAGRIVEELPESRIGRNTHYQVTLNLGGLGPDLYARRINKVVVSWDGSPDSYPELVVVPWEPGTRTLVKELDASTYMPPKTGDGDGDFNTQPDRYTDLQVSGESKVDDNGHAIRVRTFMYATESHSDYTQVTGRSDWENAYVAPTGWRILDVTPIGISFLETKISEKGDVTFDRPAGEVVRYFDVLLDRKGDEAGTYSRVTVHWQPVEIVIQQETPEWLQD